VPIDSLALGTASEPTSWFIATLQRAFKWPRQAQDRCLMGGGDVGAAFDAALARTGKSLTSKDLVALYPALPLAPTDCSLADLEQCKFFDLFDADPCLESCSVCYHMDFSLDTIRKPLTSPCAGGCATAVANVIYYSTGGYEGYAPRLKVHACLPLLKAIGPLSASTCWIHGVYRTIRPLASLGLVLGMRIALSSCCVAFIGCTAASCRWYCRAG
jgi:hypothetical protein